MEEFPKVKAAMIAAEIAHSDSRKNTANGKVEPSE
jgi:hypothetical protein